MIPREKILLLMPSIDRRVDIGCLSGLMQCAQFFHRPLFLTQMSNISLVRNQLAHWFVEKAVEYEWAMMIDSDIIFRVEDWELLWEGDEDVVAAEYGKKMLGEKPASFGLGFTRVHRSVFEKIKALTNEDGSERAQRFYHLGQMMVNYFPNGANAESRWISEDHGFFMLASLTDAKPRLEKRTKLKHVGSFEYGYPDQIDGYKLQDDEVGQ